MLNVAILQINTAFSGLISLIYLIVSTIYLDDVVKRYPEYNDSKVLLFFVVVGVWMSLFKIGFTAVIFHKLETAFKHWIIGHIFFFILSLIIFSVTISYNNLSEYKSPKGQAFIGFSGIEFLFCLFGSTLTFFFGRDTGY